MRSILLFLFIMNPTLGHAKSQTKEQPVASSTGKNEWRLFAGIGQEMRQEKNVNNEYLVQNLSNFSLGFGVGRFNWIVERTTFSSAGGNSALFVDRSYESLALWPQYEVQDFEWGTPFFTAGLGAGREQATIHLLGQLTSGESDWKTMAGLGCGFRAPLPWLWLSGEARFVQHDGWEPSPSIYLLGRVGILFE